CATIAEVRGALPGALPAGEPTMVLIETGGGAAAARVLEPVLPKALSYANVREGTYEEREKRIEDSLRARSEALGEFLHGVLAGDREQLATRAAQCAAALGDEDLLALKRADDVGTLDLELVDRGAAWLAEEALDSKEPRRNAIEAVLAAAAVRRLRDVPPPGARWATHDGCGLDIEGEAEEEGQLAVLCGMGHVPEFSRRFLYFFSAR